MTSVQALVVSGFLGSGKTTLVRRLLEAAKRDGQRIAVISNEFGELGIDQSLLGDSAEAYVELEGGCVCCRLADDLVETLQLLYERVGPERIIVETSGVALPYDTQLNFWRPPVSEWIEDDLAIVVVDAEQVLQRRDRPKPSSCLDCASFETCESATRTTREKARPSTGSWPWRSMVAAAILMCSRSRRARLR